MTPLSIFSVNVLSENLLLIVSVLIFAAVLVAKAGSKLGAPTLLLFLILGMLVGPDVLGLRFDNLELAESIGHFAMSVILFTAGLETSLDETKKVMRQGVMLSTLGNQDGSKNQHRYDQQQVLGQDIDREDGKRRH